MCEALAAPLTRLSSVPHLEALLEEAAAVAPASMFRSERYGDLQTGWTGTRAAIRDRPALYRTDESGAATCRPSSSANAADACRAARFKTASVSAR